MAPLEGVVSGAISQGAGAWGVIHPAYRAYAQAVGFHIDACAPRAGNAKGKVDTLSMRLTAATPAKRSSARFLMVLPYSRKPALIWSRGSDQLSWLRWRRAWTGSH